MQLRVDNTTYQVEKFKQTFANVQQKKSGVMFAHGFLAVGVDDKKIYNTVSGVAILPAKFETLGLAIKFAETLAKTYYNPEAVDLGHEPNCFYIWQEYKSADVFSWFKSTVPNGLIMHEVIQALRKIPDVITEVSISQAYKTAEIEVQKWKM